MKMDKVVRRDIRTIASRIKSDAKLLQGKTILITGGSGFLGKYFLYTIWYLNKYVFTKKNQCKVISLDNYITGIKATNSLLAKDKNITFILHDVRTPFETGKPVDYIIHAAGIASPSFYIRYPLETLEVAAFGTRHMLEFARAKKVKSFLYFSTSEIYGDPDPRFVPTPETYRGNVSSIGPRACYDESKRLGETLSMAYHRLYKIPINIVRPFNIYGPGMRADDYRVIPRFLTNALKGEYLPVHVGGDQTRTFCYVSDAIVAFLKILLSGKNGEVYNVGNDKPEVSIMHLAHMIRRLFGNKIKIKSITYPDTYPQGDPQRRCPDLTKIRKHLGFIPTIDLETGLSRTLAWYKIYMTS
jgi:UDP-glucuronate decarboxylase